MECLHRAGGVAWFEFGALCGWGRSQHDYLELARCFHTIMLSGVPRMGLGLADEARKDLQIFKDASDAVLSYPWFTVFDDAAAAVVLMERSAAERSLSQPSLWKWKFWR